VPKAHAVIAAPIEPPKERPPYVPPIPFSKTMQRHILMAQLVEKKEAGEKARKEGRRKGKGGHQRRNRRS
jgi:hypothetical protein